ncbi:RNA-binding protein NOB1-like isoform X2 [Penaeus chinensis]|uniref:RNA-binding protein NOB1-like isoform X2 n=1 Tax=Penaeus chinensis TaxID=139456 RepID=UPI001FB6CC62|nr:RNA-binding protein NOB1-like isoform X2 [Penaeus chinensis]
MKAKHLVADTAAFVKNVPLWEYGEEICSTPEVIGEIRDRHTKQHIQSLPVKIELKQPKPESIKFINEFSKKTGDFASLSLADIKVLALTYELEIEAQGGSDHLRSEPEKAVTEFSKPKKSTDDALKLPGFYYPSEQEGEECQQIRSQVPLDIGSLSIDENVEQLNSAGEDGDSDEEKGEQELNEQEEEEEEEEEYVYEEYCEDDERIDLENHNGDEEYDEDQNEEIIGDNVNAEEGAGGEDDDDDAGGWITLSNVKKHKMKKIGLKPEDEIEDKEVLVACMTADFAMQNVLKHIGLRVMGVDGKLIQKVRTFILRCHACFRTTSIMNRTFCQKCGNKTLKKVSVTLNPDGTKKIWVNTKKPINIKGTKFSLPMPKGGKHARNPVLAADQKEAKKHASKLSYKKINPLHIDYDTLNSPFAVRDVYSRASQLGYIAGKKNHQLYWEKKNPNEGRRTTGKRKK